MLDGLFRPRSVAIIGASNNPFSIGNIVVRNLYDVRAFSEDDGGGGQTDQRQAGSLPPMPLPPVPTVM